MLPVTSPGQPVWSYQRPTGCGSLCWAWVHVESFDGRGFSLSLCYGLNCIPQNTYVEALTPNVTVLGHRAYRRVIEANEVINGRALTSWDYHLYEETPES